MRNKAEEAQANAIRVQAGWKSPQTVQAEEGLDPQREETNILEWREKMGGAMPALPTGDSPFAGQESPPRVRESKDASGHEHDDSGRFTGGHPANTLRAMHDSPADRWHSDAKAAGHEHGYAAIDHHVNQLAKLPRGEIEAAAAHIFHDTGHTITKSQSKAAIVEGIRNRFKERLGSHDRNQFRESLEACKMPGHEITRLLEACDRRNAPDLDGIDDAA